MKSAGLESYTDHRGEADEAQDKVDPKENEQIQLRRRVLNTGRAMNQQQSSLLAHK